MSEATSRLEQWLGTRGVPPPLDVFLSKTGADRELSRSLFRAAAWAATSAAALSGRLAPDRDALLDDLRRLPAADLLAAADAASGRPAKPKIARRVQAILRGGQHSDRWEERAIAFGVPAAWAGVLARRAEISGESFVMRWLAEQPSRPPLWIRPRGEEALQALRSEGFEVSPEADGSARVSGARGIESSRAFREGLIEVQDRASQRVGLLAEPRPGQIVWDACAGRGGKTVLLGRSLAGRGALHATDIDSNKLSALKRRIKRAGLADVVRASLWDGQKIPTFGPETRKGFDVILVDAPCSSSGTWRRNPDARLRIDPRDLPRFTETQRALLRLCAGALREGGRLVYTTCSIAVEECEEVARSLDPDAPCALLGPPDLDSDTLFGATISP